MTKIRLKIHRIFSPVLIFDALKTSIIAKTQKITAESTPVSNIGKKTCEFMSISVKQSIAATNSYRNVNQRINVFMKFSLDLFIIIQKMQICR